MWHLGKELSGTAATAGMWIRAHVCAQHTVCAHLCNLHALDFTSTYGPHMLQSINMSRERRMAKSKLRDLAGVKRTALTSYMSMSILKIK